MRSTTATDAFVERALKRALQQIDTLGVPASELRERTHLDPAVKRVMSDMAGQPARSVRYRSEHFPGIGAVDVVVESPAILMELKWSYDEKRSKIFESVWDAIKLSLLAADLGHLAYVATGASIEAWANCESADLFEAGTIDPLDIWRRPLTPPGPNGGLTVGQDLVLGSPSGASPVSCPKSISVSPIVRLPYGENYELRVIRVIGSGPSTTWPQP